MLNSIHQLSQHAPVQVLGALPSQISTQPHFTKGIMYGQGAKPATMQEIKEQKAKHYFQK